MRSRVALLHTARHLSTPGEVRLNFPFSSSSSAFPRSVGRSVVTDNLRTHQLSSSASNPPEDEPNAIESAIDEAPRKRTTRTYTKASEKEDPEPVAVSSLGSNPEHFLWRPSDKPGVDSLVLGKDVFDTGLPEPWLLQDAYETLLLALHPQTQHRATYASNNGPLIEPALGFYSLVEGGDFVVDATVRSLAQRAKADVIVLDSVELTAGEHGLYGKAASVLQFPDNPLRVPSSPVASSSRSSRPFPQREEEEEYDDSGPQPFFMNAPAAFTIQIPGGASGGIPRPSRAGGVISPANRGSSSLPMQRMKGFFDELLTLTNSTKEHPEKDADALRRPRIVYVRNFPHIADQAPLWFPALHAAVRSRRQGPMARPTSPISSPTVIILGSAAPLSDRPSLSSSPSPAGNNLLSLLAATGRIPQPLKPPTRGDLSWAEADRKSRDRRLKERLRKWQKGHEGLLDEMPRFSMASALPNGSGGRRVGSNGPSFPEISLGGNIIAVPFGRVGGGDSSPADASGSSTGDGYFRVIGLVPRTRDEQLERYSRMARRLKMNELSLKLAVAEAGGVLLGHPEVSIQDVSDSLDVPPVVPSAPNGSEKSATNLATPSAPASSTRPFLDSCMLVLKSWRELKAVADAVVGAVLSDAVAEHGIQPTDPSIEATVVTWEQVSRSVESSAESTSLRNAWIEGVSGTKDIEDGGMEVDMRVDDVDEVLEAVRKDPDLDQHEQRLLSCIVDPAMMPTTFKSVHLPDTTIDSVRTMVSLPLLFPDAFATGILKTHAMTGALLFGPPGTGKTLLARAIAKESGARMMIIKPSDVMDMYVGEGEKLVRSVFTLARRLSPAVVFIDEIDALFGARVSNRESGGTMAHRGVITEFMQEMDGLKSSRDQTVIVIGATNRPFDLDDAVLRRLPRRILVDLPGPKEREEILKILLRDEQVGADVDLKNLAKRTEAFSGSDLKHLCVAAALDAVKEAVDVPWAVPSKTASTSLTTPLDVALNAEISEQPPTPLTSTPSTELLLIQKPPVSISVDSVTSSSSVTLNSTSAISNPASLPILRTLAERHFTKALHEITPSASESLGTLTSLRKWNDEFGEGAASKGRKKRGWGDKFGFGLPKEAGDGPGGDAAGVQQVIAVPVPATSTSKTRKTKPTTSSPAPATP